MFWKRGDVGTATFTVRDAAGAAVPLDGATGVTLEYRAPDGSLGSASCSITDAPNGVVEANPVPVAQSGTYRGELEITWPTGAERVPAQGTFRWEVSDPIE